MKTNFSIEKKNIQKKIKKTIPQHFCVAEDCMLLEGGVLYGFTGFIQLPIPKYLVKLGLKRLLKDDGDPYDEEDGDHLGDVDDHLDDEDIATDEDHSTATILCKVYAV